MESGSKITGNSSSSNSGGVHVAGATFMMNGGAISGNTAATDGGGMYMYNSGVYTYPCLYTIQKAEPLPAEWLEEEGTRRRWCGKLTYGANGIGVERTEFDLCGERLNRSSK